MDRFINQIIHGDCLEVLQTIPDNTFDSVVTDPPYGLSFMGKNWDHGIPGVAYWKEVLRVAKPGAYLLAFGGTRTYHRLTCAIEDAGWEIRDCIMWVYSQGFPKSLDISKQIDKIAGAQREVVDTIKKTPSASAICNEGWVRPWAVGKTTMDITAPATDEAKQWDGWGTALKPAYEPIIVARKPISEKNVALNVLKWGTGGLNIDGCRINVSDSDINIRNNISRNGTSRGIWGSGAMVGRNATLQTGRFPANLIIDDSDEVRELFPITKSGLLKAGTKRTTGGGYHGHFPEIATHYDTGNDQGSAARFFYCAKASKLDRDQGCEELEKGYKRRDDNQPYGMNTNHFRPDGSERKPVEPTHNNHPTVKPTSLMRYLCRLVTPPHGLILDCFAGSGSTGKGAVLEGFRFIGIELDAEYCEIARKRLQFAMNQMDKPKQLEMAIA